MDSDEIGRYIGGVCVALLSTTTNATGLFLQKSTHKRRELEAQPLKPVWKEKRWLLGLCCMFAGSLMSLAVFDLLGQSRASAMAAVTIVVNAIFASCFLKERFTWIDLTTTCMIGAGTVISVVFGSAATASNVQYNVQVICDLLHRNIVYISAAIIVVIYACCATFLWWTSKRADRRGVLESKLECFVRAFCAGLFSGSTGFLSKSTVVCVTNMWTTHDASDLKRVEFYCFLLFLPVSLVMQLHYINTGLRRFDAMEMVPPYQSSIVSVGVAFGWIFFDEAEGVPAQSMGLFAVGCAISIGGILLLAFKKRAMKAAMKDAGAPLLGDPHASSTTLSLEKSMETMVIIGDPAAALVSDITGEIRHAKEERMRRESAGSVDSIYGSIQLK